MQSDGPTNTVRPVGVTMDVAGGGIRIPSKMMVMTGLDDLANHYVSFPHSQKNTMTRASPAPAPGTGSDYHPSGQIRRNRLRRFLPSRSSKNQLRTTAQSNTGKPRYQESSGKSTLQVPTSTPTQLSGYDHHHHHHYGATSSPNQFYQQSRKTMDKTLLRQNSAFPTTYHQHSNHRSWSHTNMLHHSRSTNSYAAPSMTANMRNSEWATPTQPHFRHSEEAAINAWLDKAWYDKYMTSPSAVTPRYYGVHPQHNSETTSRHVSRDGDVDAYGYYHHPYGQQLYGNPLPHSVNEPTSYGSPVTPTARTPSNQNPFNPSTPSAGLSRSTSHHNMTPSAPARNSTVRSEVPSPGYPSTPRGLSRSTSHHAGLVSAVRDHRSRVHPEPNPIFPHSPHGLSSPISHANLMSGIPGRSGFHPEANPTHPPSRSASRLALTPTIQELSRVHSEAASDYTSTPLGLSRSTSHTSLASAAVQEQGSVQPQGQPQQSVAARSPSVTSFSSTPSGHPRPMVRRSSNASLHTTPVNSVQTPRHQKKSQKTFPFDFPCFEEATESHGLPQTPPDPQSQPIATFGMPSTHSNSTNNAVVSPSIHSNYGRNAVTPTRSFSPGLANFPSAPNLHEFPTYEASAPRMNEFSAGTGTNMMRHSNSSVSLTPSPASSSRAKVVTPTMERKCVCKSCGHELHTDQVCVPNDEKASNTVSTASNSLSDDTSYHAAPRASRTWNPMQEDQLDGSSTGNAVWDPPSATPNPKRSSVSALDAGLTEWLEKHIAGDMPEAPVARVGEARPRGSDRLDNSEHSKATSTTSYSTTSSEQWAAILDAAGKPPAAAPVFMRKASNPDLKMKPSKSSLKKSTSTSKVDELAPKDMKRSVSFTKIQIREYARTVGDHPSVSSGPPLSLDWHHNKDELEVDVEHFEILRTPQRRTREDFAVPSDEREEILMDEWGVSDLELQEAADLCSMAKQLRKNCARKGVLRDKVDDVFETTKRGLKRVVTGKSIDKELQELWDMTKTQHHVVKM